MRDGFIRLGDPVIGGGAVTQASGFPSDGIRIALERDKALCAVHGGEFEILGGNDFFIVNGRRSATEELSKLACGCAMISTARAFLARTSEPSSTSSYADDKRVAAPARFESRTETGVANTFAATAHSGPCGPMRWFTESDIKVIQSYNTIKETAIELRAGLGRADELRMCRQQAADALNRAAQELEMRRFCEHIEILNKVAVYMSVDTVAGAKAFVSRPPVFHLVINSEPFSRLWEGHKVGLMLHEVHHFTRQNQDMYNAQVRLNAPMGPGTGYESDCFEFQAKLGFPAN